MPVTDITGKNFGNAYCVIPPISVDGYIPFEI